MERCGVSIGFYVPTAPPWTPLPSQRGRPRNTRGCSGEGGDGIHRGSLGGVWDPWGGYGIHRGSVGGVWEHRGSLGGVWDPWSQQGGLGGSLKVSFGGGGLMGFCGELCRAWGGLWGLWGPLGK